MEVLNYLLNFFGINLLTETSTIYDLFSVCLCIFGALFLVSFVLRSLFLFLRFGER